ncbi:hypothetical protein [Vibrio aquimaris]|uniref:Uncharacterized protein n=1 Tax=Vibrio aquimaris TaxID=2587862 RepID=A0A5P9CPW4_9VIBR|nr:hypothetical protein [Vibrio aquimaris]QFT28298.1 hypothetical protein FIV01_18050 [Vibrio aquimaris]
MKKILLSSILAASFSTGATDATFTQYDHHQTMRDKASLWVDWDAQEHALSAVEALNVAKRKHGTEYMSSLFMTRLGEVANQSFNTDGLSSLEVGIISEAATLFVMSQAPDMPHHELFPSEYMLQTFLANLATELEVLYPMAEDEAMYLQRYYEHDPLGLSLFSIALNISLERYGEADLVRRLADKTNSRYSDSLRQFLIANFSAGGQFRDRLELVLLEELKQFSANWKPSYDEFSQPLNGLHPYARVGAMMQSTLLSRWSSLRQDERETLTDWHVQVSKLPSHKYGYSMVGEAVVNHFRQHKQQEHHSRWNFPTFAAITLVTLVAPELLGELALGEAAQTLLFSRTMFTGARVADAVYTDEFVELATLQTARPGAVLPQSQALSISKISSSASIGSEVEPGLHHYLGTDAIEGTDYVANVQGSWQRVRRFPFTDDYALFGGMGSLGIHKVTRTGAAGWLLNQTANSLNNWVSSGDFRHVLLLGKGQPESLFRHYGENVKSRYGIPSRNMASDGDLVSHLLNGMFPQASSSQLSSLTFNHRLDVVAHGNPYGPICSNQSGLETSLSPTELAKKLFDLGLREVGVLKVQSCNVGGGFYLTKLEQALKKTGINVGFLAAPKGYLVQLPRLPRAVFSPFPNFRSDRYEVISTGLHQGFPGTRYH